MPSTELLDLPNELIFRIAEQTCSPLKLAQLSGVCKRFKFAAETILYRHLESAHFGELQCIRRAIQASQLRSNAIRTLSLPFISDHGGLIHEFALILTHTANLRELKIGSLEGHPLVSDAMMILPPWAALWREFEMSYSISLYGSAPRAPLDCLRKLTLCLSNREQSCWLLDSMSYYVFFHPYLEELILGRMWLEDTDPATDNYLGIPRTQYWHSTYSTPLKKLVFEDCIILDEGLERLLQRPKALEHLHLNVVPFWSSLFYDDAQGTSAALKRQAHSLQSLSYFAYQPLPPHFPVRVSFVTFTNLKKITLIGHSPKFERFIMGVQPPPSLEEIVFDASHPFVPYNADSTQYFDNEDEYIPFIRAWCGAPLSLKRLTIIWDQETPEHLLLERFFIKIVGRDVESLEISFRLLCRPAAAQDRSNEWLIPLYDSDEGGFVGLFANEPR